MRGRSSHKRRRVPPLHVVLKAPLSFARRDRELFGHPRKRHPRLVVAEVGLAAAGGVTG
jgi:hypothetical protein